MIAACANEVPVVTQPLRVTKSLFASKGTEPRRFFAAPWIFQRRTMRTGHVAARITWCVVEPNTNISMALRP